MDTFRSVIELWPSLPAFAEDIDVIYVTAQGMHRRDSIPQEHWKATVSGAAKRGFHGVTLERLADIAASRKTAKSAKPDTEEAA